jgi:hypothetical protein
MLNRMFHLLLAACLSAGISCAAQSPFIGNWKLNPSRSKLTDVMKVERLGADKFIFDFGGGPETIVVDGTDQTSILGTTMSVAVSGPNTWKVNRKRGGRMLVSATWNLSEDDRTLTDHFTGFNPDGSTYTLDYVYIRKAGGAGFEGEWVSTTEEVNSVVLMQVRPYAREGLSFIDPSAQVTRNVRFDGKDYPNVGPNVTPGSTSSLRRVNERTLELTYKINGNLFYTQQIELSPDSNTLTMTRHIVGESETNIRVFERE